MNTYEMASETNHTIEYRFFDLMISVAKIANYSPLPR
jgi:hypothetical protein